VGELIVEISENDVRKPRTCRFDDFPVSVGRGYQNSVILADPFVSPEHLAITAGDSGFIVEDLGTVNGTSVRGTRLTEKICLPSGTTLRIGNSRLRLLAPTHAIPATQTLSFWAKHRALFRIVAWLSLLPVLGSFIVEEYLFTYVDVTFLELLDEVFPLLLLGPAWAGLWTVISHSATHRTRFHAQLLLASVFLILMTACTRLSEYLAYAANCDVINTLGAHLVPGLFFALLLFFNLKLATTTRRWVRIAMSLTISVPVVLLFSLSTIAERSAFSENPTSSALLKPPCFQLTKSSSLSEFLADSKQVFEDSQSRAED
jgi:hypothetical protein